MARPLRIEYDGAWYHFTSRGNERNKIFKDDNDRSKFLDILKESLEIYKVELHGYVLMENHFHLILNTPLGNLGRFAQRFNTAYTVYYNRRHKRSGHLYQGRYKAIVVEKDIYLLGLVRYIHLNPVKIKRLEIGKQIDFLRRYSWSSHPGYGLLQHRDGFVIYGDVLGYFGGDNKKGRNGYRVFVEEGLLKEISSPFKDVKGQVALGESDFVEWIYENVLKEKKPDAKEQSVSNELLKEVRLDFLIDKICEVFEVKKTDILKRRSVCKEARMALIDLCCRYRVFHKSFREIGKELGGLTVGGMCQVRKRLRCKLQKDKELRVKFNRCIEFIENE
ncbi:MAG: transposase [Candidatus Anammoxibacter sp.]